MGKVAQIGIVNIKGNRIQNVNVVEALKGKGLVNDRKFKENNEKERQITLIEIENIVRTAVLLRFHKLLTNRFSIKSLIVDNIYFIH